MPERLTPLEASLLALDTARTPAQLATVAICTAAPGTFVADRVTALIRDRIAYVPRYRQRVRRPAGPLTGAVWADDEDFDLSYHVQTLVLPRPGTDEQLQELVAELAGRRLDRARPLWAAYLIEGLSRVEPPAGADDVPESERLAFALVTVSHLALVDGADTVELTQVLLDAEPQVTVASAAPWRPAPEPVPLQLVAETVVRAVRDPVFAADRARAAVTDALGAGVAAATAGGEVARAVGELAEEALRRGRPSRGPLSGEVADGRRLALASVPLADLRSVAGHQQVSVHDVVLAAVTGALRSSLLAGGATPSSGMVLTALTPMAVVDESTDPSALGLQVASRLQRLPVGEPDALVRLQLLGFGTRTHRAAGRAVAAETLVDLAGFAPATLHALGLRAAAGTGRPYDLVISNAPGPRRPLSLAGAPLHASCPVLALAAGHLLAVGVSSYADQVTFSLVGAPDGPDLDVLVDSLQASVVELVGTATPRSRAR